MSSTWANVRASFSSWRLGAVTVQSFASGVPLGFVLALAPAWLQQGGIDIKTVGVLGLTQAPYVLKILWAPLLDRYALGRLGRRRGWILLAQICLALAFGYLATIATDIEVGAVAAMALLIAFVSASQDVVIDAYAVEALKPEEQGAAVGTRSALYRAGFMLAGRYGISIAALIGWRAMFVALALTYVALLPTTLFAPPTDVPASPKSLRDAVWLPVVGFLRRHRALEIAAFLVLYKVADNLAAALVSYFLLETGFDANAVGVGSGTISLVATVVGTFIGGFATQRMGVGRALWVFGFLQAISNLGYAAVATVGPNIAVMYTAVAIEAGTTGLGTGAFGVLLLRLTEKRFSATQYALFSSIFALGRTISSPFAGYVVDAIGWRDFFIATVFAAIPGLLLLHRFVPFGTRDIPGIDVGAEVVRTPVTRVALAVRAGLGVVGGALTGFIGTAGLAALKASRGDKPFSMAGEVARLMAPANAGDWIDVAAIVLFALTSGLLVAGYVAARRGVVAVSASAKAA